MLPKLHKSELVTWLDLLKGFQSLLTGGEVKNRTVKDAWGEIEEYLQEKILILTVEDVEITEKSLFQSWQTETHRYIRLLATDLMFLSSAKKTQSQRLTTVNERLDAVIKLTQLVANYQCDRTYYSDLASSHKWTGEGREQGIGNGE